MTITSESRITIQFLLSYHPALTSVRLLGNCSCIDYRKKGNVYHVHRFVFHRHGYTLISVFPFSLVIVLCLSKVQGRAASLDICPWCHSKGLTHPLRSCHISLEESVKLCTNPQCLFPLVSRPLEDVLSSLVVVEPATENKRKSPSPIEAEQPCAPSPKRRRVNEQDSHATDNALSDVHYTVYGCNGGVTEEVNGVKSLDANKLEDKDMNLDAVTPTDALNVSMTLENGIQNSTSPLTTHHQQVLSSLHDHSNTNTVEPDRRCSLTDRHVLANENTTLTAQTEATGTTILSTEDGMFLEAHVFKSETEDMLETHTEDLVPVPKEIFWRNVDNLCWLDSLLTALMNLKNLFKLKPKEDPGQSPMWTLLTGHEEARAALQNQQQTDKDGCLKVPSHVLHKITSDFEAYRMSVFSLLQPKLQCKLGQNDSPVFALPLLVKLDSWLEPLFQSTFYWDFKCTICKSSTKQNVVKTLPTFTNIVPDWRPLAAVHLAPCNNCPRKNQRRKMVLQGVAPVFALHFVEGIPDANIQDYNFSFHKRHYSVKAIIQYSSEREHFVTWACRSDGSWVEFDDLKYPHCKSYETLPVPAQEIHIMFWEEKEEEERHQESRACSPSTTFTTSPPVNITTHSAMDLARLGEDLSQCCPDQSLCNLQKDSDTTDSISEQDTTVTTGADTSIGSTTLLEAFEGLTHNDIVTLTLIEMNKEAENPNNGKVEETDELKSQELNDLMRKSVEHRPAPDSSSTVGAIENPKEADELLPVTDPEDNFSDDPTFEPKTKKGQMSRKAAVVTKHAKTKKVGDPKEKIASNVAKSTLCSPVTVESPTASSFSSVSSTMSTHQNALKNIPQVPPVAEQQQKGWSQLLSRSLGHMQNASKCNSTPKPVTQKPTDVTQSTIRRQTEILAKAVPKLGLWKDKKGEIPLKAAEMYGAFGSKNSKTTTTLDGSKTQPSVQKSLSGDTTLNTSISTSTVGITSDTSLKKSKSSKIPSGLSETEVLRYKLMKKLKAKKKKLAKLNELLGSQGGADFRPDSTNIHSPNTVTSSTLDDDFLSDLLSPATTITSTLSPDSTDFLEMLANGHEVTVTKASDSAVQPSAVAETDDLLDEFMSQTIAEGPTDMEADALSALDMFL